MVLLLQSTTVSSQTNAPAGSPPTSRAGTRARTHLDEVHAAIRDRVIKVCCGQDLDVL
jgi:hypothetical protein